MNLRELNHIFIPRSLERVEAWTTTPSGRFLYAVTTPLHSLTREGQAVAVAALITAAAGIDVHFSHLYLVFCGLAGLLLAALLTRRMGRAQALDVRVHHPPRVGAGQAMTFTIVVRNRGPRALFALHVHGPFLPWDGTWEEPPPRIPVLEPGAEWRGTRRARFLCRGDRYIGRFFAASVRPLGLMYGNRVFSEPVRLRVVPALVPVDGPTPPPAPASFEARGHAPLAGESFELLGVRPYRPGDRIRDLHARSWARLGEPMVREYRAAQQRRVRVALHPSARKPRREAIDAAASLTASLIDWATRREAQVELVVPAAPPVRTVVGTGEGTFERALDLLATVEAGEAAADADARIGVDAGHVGALYVVFCDFGPAQTALLGGLARHGVRLTALLVSDDARTRAAATAAGVRALSARAVAEGVALS
ncbi:MAG: DUF58 domain-containing protein [Myxococcales bacterium]|nr:DUF58 domain-containing protein [Myxococcales bacterium]